MANTLLTISMITREALAVLENDLTFTKYVRRDLDGEFGKSGAKIGTVLNIRKPPRYVGRVGQALALEDATETSVPLVLNVQRGVDIVFSSQDLALSIDDFSDRFVRPAVANVANGIDFDGLTQYLNIYNEIGTPGTVPNQLLTYLQAGQRLDEEAAPKDMDRTVIVSPAMQAIIVDTMKGLFNSTSVITSQTQKAEMNRTVGFKWDMDQNVRVQTVGSYSAIGTVNAANQSGSLITSNGWGNNVPILNQGDVISFPGCFAVNPQNKQSTGALRQFVVTQNVVSNGAGVATIPISGPGGLGIVLAGPFQTCTASPTNGGIVNISGASAVSTPRGLAFHKDAFAFGCADLPLPGGVDIADRISDKQLGCSIRLVRAYDINTDRFPTRLDILYGWTTLYPELACRIAS